MLGPPALRMNFFAATQHVDELGNLPCARFSAFHMLDPEKNGVPILAVEGRKELPGLRIFVERLLQIVRHRRCACRGTGGFPAPILPGTVDFAKPGGLHPSGRDQRFGLCLNVIFGRSCRTCVWLGSGIGHAAKPLRLDQIVRPHQAIRQPDLPPAVACSRRHNPKWTLQYLEFISPGPPQNPERPGTSPADDVVSGKAHRAENARRTSLPGSAPACRCAAAAPRQAP